MLDLFRCAGILENKSTRNFFRCPGGIELVLFLVYFPIGLILAILRLFIGFHTFLVACLLPKLSTIRR